MNKVLITGGAGYLGSVLCEMLIDKGHEVTVIDNLSYAQNTLFPMFHTGRLKFVHGDITNKKFMEKTLQEGDFDFIFPLACIVGYPCAEDKPELAWSVNYESILTILKYRKPGQKIIFPTTNSGYGITTGEVYCTEESPLNPISIYGQTKVEAEKAIMEKGEAVCFRLATLFGFSPRMRTDLLVNHFVYKAVKDKEIVLFEHTFKRNFLHVRDACRGFLWTMENWDTMKNKVYNLGHPEYNISKDELALLIKKYVPELNIFYGEVGKDVDKRNYIIYSAQSKCRC